jgi:putative restriction endonuclease
MKLFVGVTDNSWFEFLRELQPDEVNFWRPGGTGFRAIEPGAPFLFKLHSPLNFIAGGGFFVRHSVLPLSLAWKAFGRKNGADDITELRRLISKRRKDDAVDPMIGCTILAEPFFLPRDEWISVPNDWKLNIVQGKTYSFGDPEFNRLWEFALAEGAPASPIPDGAGVEENAAKYGSAYLARARLGQGAFRVLVTEAYHRRCAMTGEKVLPVLEAAHIKPYSKSGPHRTSNGLLLRSDLHALFDEGYVTISPDYHIEVSRRIKEEFNNGDAYYSLHGIELHVLPEDTGERPSKEYVDWHNTSVFRG